MNKKDQKINIELDQEVAEGIYSNLAVLVGLVKQHGRLQATILCGVFLDAVLETLVQYFTFN